MYKTYFFSSLHWQKSAHLLGIRTHSSTETVNIKTSSDSTIDLMRSRLIYQSRKRGILENCIIFTSFSDKYLKTFDYTQLKKYDALINSEFDEWELYAWAIGSKPIPEEFNNDIMSLLKNHVNKQDHKRT